MNDSNITNSRWRWISKVGLATIALLSLAVYKPSMSAQAGTLVLPHASGGSSNPEPHVSIDAVNPITVHVIKPDNREIQFRINYEAKNPDCDRFNFIQFFETSNGHESQTYFEEYSPFTGGSDFTVRLPVDRFSGGRCNWQASGLEWKVLPSVASASSLKTGSGRILLGDWGSDAEQIDYVCSSSTVAGCEISGRQMQFHAIKPSGSTLTLDFTSHD